MRYVFAVIVMLAAFQVNAEKIKQRVLVWNDFLTTYPIKPEENVSVVCINNTDGHCRDHRITHWIMTTCIDGECRDSINRGTYPPGAESLTTWAANPMVWRPGIASFNLRVCRYKAVKRENEDVWDEIEEVECSERSNTVVARFKAPTKPKNFKYER
jgi:hypothetical protein